MKTFYIAKILNQDLMSRPLADDFYNYAKILYNIGIENI